MDSANNMAGQKRARNDDDEFDWELDLEWRKRPRNDTVIEATFDMAYSDVNETPQTKPQERETLRPFLIRAQTLPFRLPSYSAPTSGQCTPSGCSTPSAHSPNSMGSPVSLSSPPTLVESTTDNEPDDIDMVLDDNQATDERKVMILSSHSPPLPFNPLHRPPRLKQHTLMMPPPQSPRSALSSARIPTPIHPSFPTTPSPLMNTPRLVSPHLPAFLYANHSPNRPMPSPIREDIMDSQLSKLTVSEESMDMDDSQLFSPTASESQFGLPPRKGRARSGAITTINRRIFTGYLADCEKCRNKVPGHYIHFLPA